MPSPGSPAEARHEVSQARGERDSTYIGADVVAGRYARNLKIFANLARAAEPGDRVLVVYGAGHGKLLRDFVRESSDLSWWTRTGTGTGERRAPAPVVRRAKAT